MMEIRDYLMECKQIVFYTDTLTREKKIVSKNKTPSRLVNTK